MSHERLEAPRIVDTVATLKKRIHERFPDAGLVHVCQQLLMLAQRTEKKASEIAEPMYVARVISGILILLVLIGLIAAILSVTPQEESLSAAELVQVVEAGANDLILIGAVVFFAVTLESKWKRARILKAIHELRGLAHIIDMHQLTKDPERTVSAPQGSRLDTASSPRRTMTPFELSRYLDYCSEMLSLIGKIAVLYVQEYPDSVAVGAVNDIESLTTGLSSKIWQKIMILHERAEPA